MFCQCHHAAVDQHHHRFSQEHCSLFESAVLHYAHLHLRLSDHSLLGCDSVDSSQLHLRWLSLSLPRSRLSLLHLVAGAAKENVCSIDFSKRKQQVLNGLIIIMALVCAITVIVRLSAFRDKHQDRIVRVKSSVYLFCIYFFSGSGFLPFL